MIPKRNLGEFDEAPSSLPESLRRSCERLPTEDKKAAIVLGSVSQDADGIEKATVLPRTFTTGAAGVSKRRFM